MKLALKTRQSFALMALALGLKCFLKELVFAQYILILGSLGDGERFERHGDGVKY